jgi:hypothetical protein
MTWQRFLCAAALLVATAGSGLASKTDAVANVNVVTNEPILRLESLTIGSTTYSNVQVTARTETDIFIRHRKGIANFKVEDVPRDVLAQLGYKLAQPAEPAGPAKTQQIEVKVNAGISNTLAIAKQNPLFMHWVKKVRARILAHNQGDTGAGASSTNSPAGETGAGSGEAGAEGEAQEAEADALPDWNQLTAKVPQLALILVSVFLVAIPLIYFFFCYTAKLICQKAGSKPGALIWLPIVSIIPLIRAARLPTWTALLFFLGPIVSAITQNPIAAAASGVVGLLFMIVWCFRIVHARGKGILTALCLIFPVTSPAAWLYLAYSR